MTTLCERIQHECQRTGRSLNYVMAKAGLGQSIFYKWRDGKSTPKVGSIKAIAEALGMAPNELSPEHSDAFQRLAQNEAHDNAAGEGVSDELVFVGMRRQALNQLKPFIKRANAHLLEVPEDLCRGLQSLMRTANGFSTTILVAS